MLQVAFGNPVFLLPVLGRGKVLQIPRNMQSSNRATVNDATKRNDVVNHVAWTTMRIAGLPQEL